MFVCNYYKLADMSNNGYMSVCCFFQDAKRRERRLTSHDSCRRLVAHNGDVPPMDALKQLCSHYPFPGLSLSNVATVSDGEAQWTRSVKIFGGVLC